MTQWNPDLFPARRRQQAPADEQLEGRNPVDATPIEAHGDRQVIGELDLQVVAAAKSQLRGRRASRPASRGLPGRSLRVPPRAWIATGGGPCAALPPGNSRPSAVAPNPAISARRSMRIKCLAMSADPDHF